MCYNLVFSIVSGNTKKQSQKVSFSKIIFTNFFAYFSLALYRMHMHAASKLNTSKRHSYGKCFSYHLGYFQILGLHDWTMMRNGVAPFNGALYSTVTTSLFTVYFRDETTSILWAFIAGGGFIRLSEITTAFLSNMHNT